MQEIQADLTAIEDCGKPVIAAVHGVCLGGATSLIAPCDIRYFTSDVVFSVKDLDLGIAADIGVLQRLEKVVSSSSWFREMAYTTRYADAMECMQFGLCSRVFPTKEQTLAAALQTATHIASLSPVATLGTKVNLAYARDHSVPEALHFLSVWQSSALQTDDQKELIQAISSQKTPKFAKL